MFPPEIYVRERLAQMLRDAENARLARLASANRTKPTHPTTRLPDTRR